MTHSLRLYEPRFPFQSTFLSQFSLTLTLTLEEYT